MYGSSKAYFTEKIAEIEKAGLFKRERVIDNPQQGWRKCWSSTDLHNESRGETMSQYDRRAELSSSLTLSAGESASSAIKDHAVWTAAK